MHWGYEPRRPIVTRSGGAIRGSLRCHKRCIDNSSNYLRRVNYLKFGDKLRTVTFLKQFEKFPGFLRLRTFNPVLEGKRKLG